MRARCDRRDWGSTVTPLPSPAVAAMAADLSAHPEELAAWMGRIQRATGGRRRELSPEEVARYRLGLCIRCETPRPSAGRYCGEGCRRERNRPGHRPIGWRLEADRRKAAMMGDALDRATDSAASWFTRKGGGATPETMAVIDEWVQAYRARIDLMAAVCAGLGPDASPVDARRAIAAALGWPA